MAQDRETKRSIVEESQRNRLGSAAEYVGATWDEAVDAVLDIMEEKGVLALDAVNIYRLRQVERVRTSAKRTVTHEITSFRVPRIVMDTALDLAGGDITRLRLSPDGTITVVNQGKDDV